MQLPLGVGVIVQSWMAQLWFSSPSGAVVTEYDFESIVLSLTQDSLDLQIGDAVELAVADAEWALLTHSDSVSIE